MRTLRCWSLVVCAMFLLAAPAAAQQRPAKKAPATRPAAPANNTAAPAKKPPAAAAATHPKPVELKYIAPSALTAWFVHPQQLLASPSFQAMPIEIIEAVAKEEAGIDIDTVDEVVFLMSFNPAQPPPPLPAWIVRFNKPCDKEAITRHLSSGAGPKIGNFDSHQAKKADPLLMLIPDDHTLLLGSQRDLTEMTSGKKTPSPLVDRLITVDREELLTGIVVLDPVRPLVKGMLAQLQQLPPDFQQFAEVADLLDAVELHLRSREAGSETSLVLAGTSQGAAARLDQLIDNAIALGTAAIDEQLAQAAARDPGPVSQATGRYVKRILKSAIDAVHREQARNRLTLRLEGGNDASVAVATNGVLVALLLPAVQAAREAARRSQSNNNLKQIALGMQTYADIHKAFPARARFEDGKPIMFGWMTVEELIRFTAPFYPTWDHALAGRYVRQFDLPLRTKVKRLSKGENVRLGLLLALAHRPELVILDDPALGLDPIMRKEFNRDLVTHLQGEGRTVFYSSHLLYEVEPVADAVAILDHGVIVKQATTECLRAEVKRIVLAATAFYEHRSSFSSLDIEHRGEETAVVVDNAPAALAALESAGEPHRTFELNLDEIFEAYVAGRLADGDGAGAPSAAESLA